MAVVDAIVPLALAGAIIIVAFAVSDFIRKASTVKFVAPSFAVQAEK
jgi:hypothetical protein